jgi:predicted ester cyclase
MGQTHLVADLLERLRRLWTEPVGDDSAASVAFAEVYADPLVVNGMPMTVAQLVDRARSLQKSFDGLSMQIVDQVDRSDRLVIVFLMRGRHVGPYASPLGTVPPTGREIQVRTIDVLTVEDGLITGIWVVADDLGLLSQLDAVALGGEP